MRFNYKTGEVRGEFHVRQIHHKIECFEIPTYIAPNFSVSQRGKFATQRFQGWESFVQQVSNEKNPGCLGYFSGMKFTTQLCGDCFINHDIRIPMKQPGFNTVKVFFSWLTFSFSRGLSNQGFLLNMESIRGGPFFSCFSFFLGHGNSTSHLSLETMGNSAWWNLTLRCSHSGKTNIATENGPFKDIFPVKNGDIPLLC